MLLQRDGLPVEAVPPIRALALEIIRTLLADGSPCRGRVRRRLRRRLAADPERPEQALLEHLIANCRDRTLPRPDMSTQQHTPEGRAHAQGRGGREE